MKDRLDVCHETIDEESCESLIVSVKTISKDKFETRFNLNYKDEISPLMAVCIDEMNRTDAVREFFLSIVDMYIEQESSNNNLY